MLLFFQYRKRYLVKTALIRLFEVDVYALYADKTENNRQYEWHYLMQTSDGAFHLPSYLNLEKYVRITEQNLVCRNKQLFKADLETLIV